MKREERRRQAVFWWKTSHPNPPVSARSSDTNTIYLIQAGVKKKQKTHLIACVSIYRAGSRTTAGFLVCLLFFIFLKAGWNLPEQVGEDLSQCTLVSGFFFFYFMSDFKKTDNESGGGGFHWGVVLNMYSNACFQMIDCASGSRIMGRSDMFCREHACRVVKAINFSMHTDSES